jgi:zinc/manganese transport system permease protein
VSQVLRDIVEPGFLASSVVRIALLVGAMVAVASGVAGVFMVIRGQSFAGHALADVSSTGASGAFLVGLNPLIGFVGMSVLAAGVMEMIGIRRPRGRDLATGIVLGAALGLAALFLYWDTTVKDTTGATITIFFGSIFALSSSSVPLVGGFALLACAIVAVLYRPLLLSSVSLDLARARGVPVRLVGMAYLLALALAVSLSAMTIGAILGTALLVGPAAGALRLTRKPHWAMLIAAAAGVALTWLGVLLAYDSFYWPPVGHGWPVSFFVVVLVFLFYLGAQWSWGRRQGRFARAPQGR